jgi:hypothetical protein
MAEPIFYRYIACSTSEELRLLSRALAVSHDFQGKIASWTLEIHVRTRASSQEQITETEVIARLLSYTSRLRVLSIPSCPATRGMASAASSVSATSLQRVTWAFVGSGSILAMSSMGSFKQLQQMSLRVSSGFDSAAAPDITPLSRLQGWTFPELYFLHLEAGAADDSVNAYLDFLAKCQFPKLEEVVLSFYTLNRHKVSSLDNFFANHPGLAFVSITCQLVPSRHLSDPLATLLSRIDAQQIAMVQWWSALQALPQLSCRTRLIELYGASDREEDLHRILEAIVEWNAQDHGQHRLFLGLRGYPSDPFLWRCPRRTTACFVGQMACHAFRLKTIGVEILDDEDSCIATAGAVSPNQLLAGGSTACFEH